MMVLRLGGRRGDRVFGGDAVFDPYYKWLGIRPEHQPPDHYRLLGLDTFESDADVIQAASERQMAHIQSYKIGPQSDLSQRVLNEIAKAKVCLVNPLSKSEYDRSLRERSKQPAVVAPPTVKPAVLTQTSTIDDVTLLVPRSHGGYRPSRSRNRNRSLGTAISLGCVGLILVAIVGAFLFKGKAPPELSKKSVPQTVPSPRERQRPNPTSTTLPKPAIPLIPAPTPESDVTTSPAHKPTPDPAPSTRTLPTPSPAHKPTPDPVPRLPAPNAEQLKQAKATVNTVFAMVDLPIRGNLEPAPLPIHDNTSFIDVLAPSRSPLKFSVEAASDGMSWTITAANRAIAKIVRGKVAGDEFMFTWNDGGSDEADSLRNALLIVHGGAEPIAIALRRTVEIESPAVDLSKDTFTVPLNVPLWGLSPRDLKLEAIDMENAVVATRFPADGCVSHGSPARLVIRDQLPKAGVELSLIGISPMLIRAKPIFEDFDTNVNPWTSARMKSLAGLYVRQTNDCNRQIPNLKTSIPAIQADKTALERAYNPKAPNGIFISNQINRLASELESAQNDLARLERALPILVAQHKAYSSLFALSESVHGRARLGFRVFFTVGNCTVNILQTGPKTTVGELLAAEPVPVDVARPLVRPGAEPAPPVGPVWTDASQAIEQPPIRATIVGVSIETMRLESASRTQIARSKPEKKLRVRVAIENVSTNQIVAVPGWNGGGALPDGVGDLLKGSELGGQSSAATATAVLTDNIGNNYPQVPSLRLPAAQADLNPNPALRPGQKIERLIVFDHPLDSVEYLRLELPATGFGGGEPLRFQIPKSLLSGM